MNSQFENKGLLFVSPSNSSPSEEIAPYLDLLFPNVPERAKQNNVLLKREEFYLIEKALDSQEYCCNYDVTIVIDHGARIEDQVRDKVDELGRKPRINCAFLCCILTMVNSDHEHAALDLNLLIYDRFGDWRHTVSSWGRTTTNLMCGPVSDFYTNFTHLESFPYFSHSYVNEADSSLIEFYSGSLCRAFRISPVPSFVIKSANSNDIWKLFHDCITWLAGSYLRVNTVVGVNNSPEIYSVEILIFDSTVDNLVQLADRLRTCPVTREALLLSAKMKASVYVLQLRLLQYLMDHPQASRLPTREDVDDINELLAEDIDCAQRLCPDLEIKHLECVPRINVLRVERFAEHVQSEIQYYHDILNRPEIRGLRTQLRPCDAIVYATYAIVHDTIPQTFGPVSAWYSGAQGLTLRGRAICTLMGTENITITNDKVSDYLEGLDPGEDIIDEEVEHDPIELEWINDPHALATDRGIPPNQLTPENYNSNSTLGGRIKFRYLSDEGLREIARAINASDVGDNADTLAWNILRNKRQTRKRPLLINQPRTRSMHVVLYELSPPLTG